MRALAALVAIVVLLFTGTAGPVWAQDAPAAPGLLLTFDDVEPHVVTTDGPAAVTLAGTLRNTGTVPVRDLVVRLQRGEAQDAEGTVRDALDGSAPTDAVTPQFTPLADALAPGAQTPVRISVPVRGPATSSLALSQPGTYEILVNVNGSPEGGARARLAAVRMLLPVLSLPAADGFRAVPATPPDAGASPFTLLYPIAEVPRRIATVPGTPVLLSDDLLAASFAPGGRLGGLVTALAQQAPAGSPVRAATCLAIDPDLVETASLMSDQPGYQVAQPDGTTRAGAGSAAAGQWLAQLRSVARGGCVIALPYADADLVALTRGGRGADATSALADGRRILADVLQTPVTDVAWPADGLLDEATLPVVTGAGTTAAVLATDGVRTPGRAGVVPVAGGGLRAVLADPLLSRAAAGPRGTPSDPVPGRGAAAASTSPAGTDTALSTQDAIGVLAFRSGSGRPLVFAPPHRWSTDGTGAAALLAAAGQLVAAGELTPRSLVEAVQTPSGAVGVPLDYPLSAGAAEIAPEAVATIGKADGELADLRSAVVPNSGVGLTPDQLFTPLQLGLLRPASATRRGDATGAQDAATAALATVDEIRHAVHVLEPAGPYSLGTSDAPLPITVANGLPVTVRVKVELASTSGLRVAPIEPQQIPPLGRRQLSVNAQVTRAGQFVVDATVSTPDGDRLGPPSRLRIHSTAYGTITGWLTAIAGGILVLLVARRIWRRARGDGARPTDRVAPAPPGPDQPTAPSRWRIPAPERPTEQLPRVRDGLPPRLREGIPQPVRDGTPPFVPAAGDVRSGPPGPPLPPRPGPPGPPPRRPGPR